MYFLSAIRFNYFGTTPRGKMNRTTEALLVKYVYAVHYWGICYTTSFAVPRDVVEREAGEWTARVLKTACMFGDRKIRKYGYTPLKG